jgi:hypothetical protein
MSFYVDTKVTMAGDNRLAAHIKRMKMDLPVIGFRTINEIAKRTQLSMKLRAPRDRGDLRDSIQINVLSQSRLELSTGNGLERPYDVYQNYGFTPHFVHISMIKAGNLQRFMTSRGIRMVMVRKHKPFVEPTITEYLIPNAPIIVQQIFEQFLKESMT